GFLVYAFKQINKESTPSEKFDLAKLETVTSRGNIYEHDRNGRLTENGHYIWINVSFKELRESWKRRSAIDYSDKDLKGNDIEYTLIRFLASKGLKKDADAVESLTDEEVKAIERGVVNVNYQDLSSLEGRLHEIAWELDVYKTTGDPNGHSITMRFEFWKAAVGIIKENLLIGVGTGDIAKAFELQYDKMNSPLHKEWRLRSHNQYLSIAVAFGILGLLWFLITLFYPMFILNKQFDYLYVTFLIIATISFLTEDTLETQAGVTFFAFLNSFFLFVKKAD
ncbi:MAG: O-antigen ligase family protein, partial [Bacteroidetes bacterium]|nr:O-antigen ligase family protein [Bacteroidota bacterium]